MCFSIGYSLIVLLDGLLPKGHVLCPLLRNLLILALFAVTLASTPLFIAPRRHTCRHLLCLPLCPLLGIVCPLLGFVLILALFAGRIGFKYFIRKVFHMGGLGSGLLLLIRDQSVFSSPLSNRTEHGVPRRFTYHYGTSRS